MATIFRKHRASLPTLPVEILHQIFSELDGTTVILSVRNVCRQLREATKTHHRYELDLTSLSKPSFHLLLTLIHPDHVTNLTVSDGEMTPGQIGVFLSFVDIDLFSRLRSLTLLEIDERNLCVFLQHARRSSFSSLTIKTRFSNHPKKVLLDHLSAIISQPTLRQLQLLGTQGSKLIDGFPWPLQCKLRHVTLENCQEEQVLKILQCAADLEILELRGQVIIVANQEFDAEVISLTPPSRLSSLRLINTTLSMHNIESLLSKTPFLSHLQITGYAAALSNGSLWENLIQKNVPLLTKFELYTYFTGFRNSQSKPGAEINYMIAAFSTLFWIEEKHWCVMCNWLVNRDEFEIYTSPICTSSPPLTFDENTKTVSNFDWERQPSTMSECDKLFTEILFQDKNDERSYPRFENVTDLTVKLFSAQICRPFASIVDLSKVTNLSLSFVCSSRPSDTQLDSMIYLLRHASTLHSLVFSWLERFCADSTFIQKKFVAILSSVNQSTIRHLDIPVDNADQVKMILSGLKHLFSVRFRVLKPSISREIREQLTKCTRDSSVQETLSSISVWFGERVESQNVCKRIKLSHSTKNRLQEI